VHDCAKAERAQQITNYHNNYCRKYDLQIKVRKILTLHKVKQLASRRKLIGTPPPLSAERRCTTADENDTARISIQEYGGGCKKDEAMLLVFG